MSIAATFQPTSQDLGSMETFKAFLSNFKIVDIGIVAQVLDAGATCIVQLCNKAETRLKADAISIGSFQNSLGSIAVGQLVLVFFPCSAVDMQTSQVAVQEQPFAKTYAKCLPIALMGKNDINLLQTAGGPRIVSDSYSVSFEKNQVVVAGQDVHAIIDFKQKQLLTAFGSTVVSTDTRGVDIQTGYKYNEDPKAHVKIASDGSLDIVTQKTVNLEAKGAVALQSEGKYSISNQTADLYKILLQVLCILDGKSEEMQMPFKTQGTSTAQQAVPGQFTAIITSLKALLQEG